MRKSLFIGFLLAISCFLGGVVFASSGWFRDVPASAWYQPAVQHLATLGVIKGYPDGTFRPEQSVTRAELAQTLHNFYLALEREKTTDAVEDQLVINAVANALPSVVVVENGDRLGSGFFVDGKRVITAAHVVEGSNAVVVGTITGKRYSAQVVKRSETLDLALLDVKTTETAKPVRFASSYRVGQTVIAIGHPQGLTYSVTRGIISHTDRVVDGLSEHYLQFDTPVNPGNSGGPLIDLTGKVVGLVVFKGSDAGIEGLGFAVRAEDIRRFLGT